METPETPTELPIRIVDGLERIAAVMRSAEWQNAHAAGVNPAQFAILKALAGRRAGLSVKALAAQLGVSQPSATDSILALERKGLVDKHPDPADRRVVRVLCTPSGRALLAENRGPGAAERAAASLDPEAQEQLLASLVAMIRHLQEVGAIPMQRICVSCRYFSPFAHPDAALPHHCHFVDAPFGRNDLRIDCHDHETADPALRAATWNAFVKDRSHLPPG